MRLSFVTAVLVLLLGGVAGAYADAPSYPVPGTVAMIDFGAKSCIPCKMMAPILEKLEKEYRGKADIVFIDVRENMDEARKHGIRALPTQIFYGKKGEEVSRHEGFMDEKRIRGIIDGLLAE